MAGSFISIRGTVISTTLVKPIVSRISFTCTSCHDTIIITPQNKKYKQPTKCTSYKCTGREFVQRREDILNTRSTDFQCIAIVDMSDPRTPAIQCELTHDLVDKLIPGDACCITGEVKVDESTNSQNTRLVMHANSITKAAYENEYANIKESEFVKDLVDYTSLDLQGIKEVHSAGLGDVLCPLTQSFCPSVFGHDLVKGTPSHVHSCIIL